MPPSLPSRRGCPRPGYELPSSDRHPLTEVAEGSDIGWVGVFGVDVHIRCGARTEPEVEPVEVVLAARPAVPAGAEAQADPPHMVLGSEHGQGDERIQFVAGLGARIGEARGHLVAPRAVSCIGARSSVRVRNPRGGSPRPRRNPLIQGRVDS